jgi:3-oxoadipate enol-lactonase
MTEMPSSLAFGYLGPNERSFEAYKLSSILRPRIVTSKDGRRLMAFEAGPETAPTVVVVNPLGTTCLLFIKVIAELARTHRVVTWESRNLPDNFPDDEAPSPREWEPEIQAQDMRAVLAAAGVAHVESVVAYCSASYLTLYSVAHGIIAPRRMALISPAVEVGSGRETTLYQKTIPLLLTRIARSGPKAAAVVRALLQQGAQTSPGNEDHQFSIFNNLPFRSDEHTYRYACLHSAWRPILWNELVSSITTQTAIFQGTGDDIVHPETAAALAKSISGTELRVYEQQGHFALYSCAELVHDAVRFATNTPQ